MSKNVQLVIPMSGIGKRFLDAGYVDPKPLIEVDKKPIIEHVLNMFNRPDDAIFICNEIHLAETNMRGILESLSPNCKIYSVPNKNRKGPVDAIMQCKESIDDDAEIIVSYCDYGTTWNFHKFLTEIKTNNWDGAIPCYTGFHPHMLGSDNYAFCKETNKILEQIKEKEPFTNNKMSEFASNGAYYFKSGKLMKHYFQKTIDLDLNLRGEYYVSVVYNLLVQDGLKVGIFEIDKMLQLGTPYDLEVYKMWSSFFNESYGNQTLITNPPKTTTIIPMAGKGSRFEQEGYVTPKPLIDVDGESMVVRAVKCLPQSDNTVFVCLQEHLDSSSIKTTLEAEFVGSKIIPIETVTNGQATTCRIAITEASINLEEPIQISACDNGVFYNEEEYKKLLQDESVDVIVWAFTNNPTSKNNPNMYAWLDVDENNNIRHVSCKKFIYNNPLTTPAIIGTMFFRKGKYFLDAYEKNVKEQITTNGEYYVDDAINQCIKSGLNVKVFCCTNYICWGTPNDLKTYNYWKEHFLK
jgi:NDP-sugar pyrophosphorylase family protein